LTPEIRSASTVSSFKKSLMNYVNLLKPPRYYLYGCRVLNILRTRLRHRSSNLNAILFRVNLINDPGCVWMGNRGCDSLFSSELFIC
jgi:hypothetical protein